MMQSSYTKLYDAFQKTRIECPLEIHEKFSSSRAIEG